MGSCISAASSEERQVRKLVNKQAQRQKKIQSATDKLERHKLELAMHEITMIAMLKKRTPKEDDLLYRKWNTWKYDENGQSIC